MARCLPQPSEGEASASRWHASAWPAISPPRWARAGAAIRMKKNRCVSVPDVKRILKQGGDSGVRKDGRPDRKGS